MILDFSDAETFEKFDDFNLKLSKPIALSIPLLLKAFAPSFLIQSSGSRLSGIAIILGSTPPFSNENPALNVALMPAESPS